MRYSCKLDADNCKVSLLFLAFLWTVSAVIGAFTCTVSVPSFSLMRLLCISKVSIVGLIVSAFLPYFLLVIILHSCNLLFSLLFLAFRGMLFGYCMFSVIGVFGDAAWLICILLMFSSCFLNLILFNSFICIKRFTLFNCIPSVFALICIMIIDYFLVAPFLGLLMNSV